MGLCIYWNWTLCLVAEIIEFIALLNYQVFEEEKNEKSGQILLHL